MTDGPRWWRGGVLYEVYPWSFADSDGDGVGDLRGAIERLDHVARLGADAVWITPWFPSPMVDGGYDVADYCDIDPKLGSLDQADELIERAHAMALKVVIDMVANHSSDQHPWFQEALRAGADDPARHRYVFRPGRGDSGELPPNNWVCAFGSSAWTRTAAADGTPGDWYLHTFSPEQPDLNWASPLVQDDMLEVLRFWYGRGIDGMRIDAVPAMWKADGLPDAGYDPADGFDSRGWTDSPHWDHPGIHDVLRRWRAAADDVGLSRARAMALVQFGLPGSPCVYQGDELGLPEVLDLPDWALATDPVFGRSDGASRGRAGCRVPLPWDAAEPAFGFSDAAPWLPQPTEWATASIAAQTGDPASTLELFRSALALRRARGLGGSEDFAWSDDGGAVLRFVRGDVEVVANMGEVPVEIDEAAVLISSGPRESGVLPPDAAVWLDSRAAAGPA